MKKEFTGKWVGGMAFDIPMDGHHVMVDAEEQFGGQDKGPRPKNLMVASLIGCTGMDVIAILNKMRVQVEEFSIDVKTELTEEHPKHFTSMHLIYRFKGKNLPLENLKKAVELSQDRYCGVSAVYKKALNLTYEIVVEE